MFSSAFQRFEKSMEIGYEQWHDGTGYDLEAIDQFTLGEKQRAEKRLIPRAGNDWRDLEALDRLGTPTAIQAILETRLKGEVQIRLTAHLYGPEPTDAEWERAILASLEVAEIYSGLIQVLNCAISHPTSVVVATLWAKVRNPESGVAYHCAAALCCIKGVIDSLYSDARRDLFLRLVGPSSEDRTLAINDLEAILES
jgi:hypothetical protein